MKKIVLALLLGIFAIGAMTAAVGCDDKKDGTKASGETKKTT